MTDPNRPPGIFFEAVDTYGLESPESYWNTMVRDVARALSEAGAPCEPFSLQDRELDHISFDTSALPGFALSWNFNCGRWALHRGEKVSIASFLPVKQIVLLMDHPVHWAESVQRMRVSDAEVARPPFHIGAMDAGHVDYLVELGLAPERVFQMRQAGPPPNPDPPDFDDREIDFLFHGTINGIEDFETFCARNAIADDGVKLAVQRAITQIIEEPVDVYAAVRDLVILPYGLAATPLDAARLTREIDSLTRAIRRFAFLSGLGGLKIHYIGAVDPEFQAANPNGAYLGSLAFDAIKRHLDTAKVNLSETINLRDSALIRLFYAAAHGCVPATEMNPYLEAEFGDGQSILALTLGDPAGIHDFRRQPSPSHPSTSSG